MPSLILSNPLGADDAQEIGLEPREFVVGEVVTVSDYVFATLIRTGYGIPYGTAQEILLVGNGSPTEAIGVDGQWYLDRLNEVLWGPKVGGYWPSDPIRPDRGVQQLRIDTEGAERHLVVVYSTGTEVDLGDIRGPAGPVTPATADTIGQIKLAGDLGGTADAPTVPRLAGIDGRLDGHDGRLDGHDTAIADRIPLSQKGAAGGVATLDPGGLIPSAQLPALAITNTFPVSNQAEMLALTAQVGDVAIRADGAGTFILRAEPATVLANWSALAPPAAGVASVDGRTGVVSLTDLYLPQTAKGAAGGVASLGTDGKVPSAQLPASSGTGGGGGDAGFVLATPTADPNVPLDLSISSKWGITGDQTNLAPNPRFVSTGTAPSQITASNTGTVTRTFSTGIGAVGYPTGVTTARQIAASALGATAQDRAGDYFDLPVTAGAAYAFSVYLRRLSGSVTKTFRMRVDWVNAANVATAPAVVNATAVAVADTTVRRLTGTATAPADAAVARVYVWAEGAGGVAEAFTFDYSALLVEASTLVHDYFDGSSTGGSWNGTANASSSLLPGGQSYYDDAGAPAEEAGILVPDPDTGSVAVWRPGAPYTNALDTRLGLLGYGRDRGAGVVLPTTNLRRGDTFWHDGLASLMRWNGTAWRQTGTAEVANDAAVRAISATYAAALHRGFRVRDLAADREWEWTGTFWRVLFGAPAINAFSTAAVSVANNTWTLIPMNAVRNDDWGAVNLTSGIFTCPVTGVYRYSGSVGWNGATGAGDRAVSIYWRDTVADTFASITRSWGKVAAIASASASVTAPVVIAEHPAGAQLAVYGFQSSGAALIAAQQVVSALTVELIEQTG